jgi:hypothetical protein
MQNYLQPEISDRCENFEQSQASELSKEMGVRQQFYILDTSFVTTLPKNIPGRTI